MTPQRHLTILSRNVVGIYLAGLIRHVTDKFYAV